jgi:ribosomal protein S18 acetylase RimI-like enzyme
MEVVLGAPVLTSDLASREREFQALESLASLAFHEFVFDDRRSADAFRAFLFERGVAEYAPPAGRLLLVDGEPAGMLALLSPRLLLRRRIAAAVATGREPRWRNDAELQRRFALAFTTLPKPPADAAYLARLAVDPRYEGQGLARWMLGEAVRATRREGLPRVVLDVADDSVRAIELYRKFGFVEYGRSSVEDPARERRLGYLHLSLAV